MNKDEIYSYDKKDEGQMEQLPIKIKELKGFPKVYNPVHNHIVHSIGEITLPMCKSNLKTIKKIIDPLSIDSLRKLVVYCRTLAEERIKEELDRKNYAKQR